MVFEGARVAIDTTAERFPEMRDMFGAANDLERDAQAFWERCRQAQGIVILHHIDADGWASMALFRFAMERIGVESDKIVYIPTSTGLSLDAWEVQINKADAWLPSIDTVVVLDISLGVLPQALERFEKRVTLLQMDHHHLEEGRDIVGDLRVVASKYAPRWKQASASLLRSMLSSSMAGCRDYPLDYTVDLLAAVGWIGDIRDIDDPAVVEFLGTMFSDVGLQQVIHLAELFNLGVVTPNLEQDQQVYEAMLLQLNSAIVSLFETKVETIIENLEQSEYLCRVDAAIQCCFTQLSKWLRENSEYTEQYKKENIVPLFFVEIESPYYLGEALLKYILRRLDIGFEYVVVLLEKNNATTNTVAFGDFADVNLATVAQKASEAGGGHRHRAGARLVETDVAEATDIWKRAFRKSGAKLADEIPRKTIVIPE